MGAGAAVTAVIIGAGMSGLLAGIRLKQSGIDDFVILEKSQDVGGTWLDNTYPGAGCDVPSHLYSYSFAPNPDWTRLFARQPEIHAYFRRVAEDFGLLPHLRFGVEVTGADYDEAAAAWTVRTRGGDDWISTLLIVGVGQLNRPVIPEMPGRDSFRGVQFHSARWNHDVDLRGKRVASIGNGASAVQYIPEITPVAGRLTVFQRSANWVVPRPDMEIGPAVRAAFRAVPALARLLRLYIYASAEARWGAFTDSDGFMARYLRRMAIKHLEAQVPDPVLRARLTPDYPIGCKRVLISNDFYPALMRENVEVVTDPIARITPEGAELADGRLVPLDVIIWGTGFEATGFLAPMTIRGRGGLALHEVWAKGAEAHRGVAVAGFPNMIVLYGPNTNLGHNSIIFMVEQQMEYALGLIQTLGNRNLASFEVRAEAQAAYNARLQAELGRTVWVAGCRNWYLRDGKVINNWSRSTLAFRRQMRRLDLDSYRFEPKAAELPITG